MSHIKLTLAYDGTEFRGWQTQPGQPTIQGTLVDILGRLTQEAVTVRGAGRTDAGVHAADQVADFHTSSNLAAPEFQRALNALLPPSIRVLTAAEVSPEFHSRRDALAKTYRYRIFRGPVVPPFVCRHVHHDPSSLDFDAMAEAARLFEGEHDFTSFAASSGSEQEDLERTVVRVIYRSEMVRCPSAIHGAGEEWVYVIRGKAFLRYMVRNIVGTLVEVGRGRMTTADISSLFECRDRARAGPTMPPQGLCLSEVEYPDTAPAMP